ncbi:MULTISPECIES: mechanosensitive ion channel family protein [unclassified Schaalia]|uniref:mechanosensitive ion channel family protein n=1 Tax=unclassified Schaalia TaxID=2691889 RepID=UPI001E429222|nr:MULTISPECIES: mechanosensitive ion channel family protein [unclassified Schaalia]MCD4548944.1 mechanosensitive ion channel family protein [Schaalia sp. lx-260]MCD4557553.1 mechanosensitive ion channel family protein [Schaalia sp. lx-100]
MTDLMNAAHNLFSFLLKSAEEEAQSGTAAEAVENTIDLVFLTGATLAGAAIAFIVTTIMAVIARNLTRRSAVLAALMKRIRVAVYVALMLWGAWGGLQIALLNTDLANWSHTSALLVVLHSIVVLGILALTAIAYKAAWIFQDAARLRQSSDHGRARRFETQAQIIRRLVQVLVVVVGVCTALYTFETVRIAMTTVLASAGLLSVVAGLAAQQTLGNVFAGLQLAFTDAIRVGDVVVVGPNGESGAVEEITLSYVVVRVWDERRFIVPSTHFTSTTFENWTRRTATRLGRVEIQLDWSAPMALIRQYVEKLLLSSDLWDGRTWAVQISAADTNTVTVSILVSARTSGDLWDLRCYIREKLIQWIVCEEPWARPAQRIQPQEIQLVEHDTSREEIARLAAELAGISDENAHEDTQISHKTAADEHNVTDPVHAARLQASRRRSKRARRRAMAVRQRELAEGGKLQSAPEGEDAHADEDGTQMLSATTVMRVIQTHRTHSPENLLVTDGKGERLYSGSAEAKERSSMWEGPGQEVLAEREEMTRLRDTRIKQDENFAAGMEPERKTSEEHDSNVRVIPAEESLTQTRQMQAVDTTEPSDNASAPKKARKKNRR